MSGRVLLRWFALLLLCGGGLAARAADAPDQAHKAYVWSASRHPHHWRAVLGSTLIEVTRPAKADPKTRSRLPWVRIASEGGAGVRFQANEWDGEGDEAGITFRTDPLDPAHGSIDILAAWYTGGAHCCTVVKVASLIGAQWKLVDLGMWDGDPDGFPQPRIGPDGAPVLPLWDGAFNYAFTSYADSGVPLKLLRIDNGRTVDVTKQPQYRDWVLADMAKWRELCVDPKQQVRNGFCAAYAADAASAGVLRAAWPVVLQNSQDEHASFCRVDAGAACKDAVKFDHYADGLRWFLQEHGYAPQ